MSRTGDHVCSCAFEWGLEGATGAMGTWFPAYSQALAVPVRQAALVSIGPVLLTQRWGCHGRGGPLLEPTFLKHPSPAQPFSPVWFQSSVFLSTLVMNSQRLCTEERRAPFMAGNLTKMNTLESPQLLQGPTCHVNKMNTPCTDSSASLGCPPHPWVE